jgi:hypothetical protein
LSKINCEIGESHCIETIGEYLEDIDNSSYNMDDFIVKDAILQKKSSRSIDIVHYDSNKTLCFTKSYGKLLKGSGSLLQISPKELVNPYNPHLNRILEK